MKKLVVKSQINRLFIEFINQISSFISIVIVSNRLSLEIFGLLSFGAIIVGSANLIIFWGYLPQLIQSYNEDNKLNYLKNCKMILQNKIASSIILGTVIFILLNLLDYDLYFIIGLILASISSGLIPINFFQSMNRSNELILFYLFARILFVILIFLIVDSNIKINYFFYIHSFCTFIITFFGYKILFKEGLNPLNNFKFSFFILKKNFFNFISILLNNHILLIWGLVLAFFGNNFLIAIFNLNYQFLKAGMSITEISGRVNSFFLKPKSKEVDFIFFFKIISLYIVLSLFGLVTIEHVFKIFFSGEYLKAIPYLKLIIILWFLNSIIKTINYNLSFSLIDIINKYVIYSSILHLIFIPIWAIFFKDSLDNLYLILVFILMAQIIFLIFKTYKLFIKIDF